MSAAREFQELTTTVSSIYDLRGIGVSAVYVSENLWIWMREQSNLVPFDAESNNWPMLNNRRADQYYSEAEVKFHKTKTGSLTATMQPYGADRIPVKVKYSGTNPWKIVCGYRKED